MKKLISLLIVCVSFTFSAIGQNYLLNPQASSLTWTGKAAFNSYALSGSLEAQSGSLYLEDEQVISSELVVDMKSLDAENPDLKKHLRSKDFFEVKKYPQARFDLGSSFTLKEGEQIVAGNLSIKNKSLPQDITLHMKKVGESWALSGKLILDRTQYGIYYNSPNFFEKLKGQAIADEFELAFTLTFQPKVAQ